MGISSDGAPLKRCAARGRLTIAHRLRRCQITWRTILGPLFIGTALLAAAPAAQERTKPEADAAALAQRTLAAKLSVALERIDVVRISPVQWRDSSLGCPERGITYTPALASGYEVTLRNAEREHVVHVAGGRAVICGAQSDSKRPSEAIVASSLKAADAVRTAIAARLGIEPARVRVVSTRPFRSSAPCPGAAAPPKSSALIVEAEAAGQPFRFYTDDSQILNCDK